MKKSMLNNVAVAVAALPLVYLSVVYGRLPQTVPMKFGLDMQPSRWGDKSELWFVTVLIAALSVGVYFLLNNLHHIDPKRRSVQPSAVFQKLGFGLLVFMVLLNFLLVEMVKGELNSSTFLFPLCGLLFAFTGNYMHTIKPNYFAGFRLPWTLSSDDNWRKTHRLGGRLWFFVGLLITAVCPLLPVVSASYFFIAALAVMVCVPLVYSYRLFKNKQESL